MNNTNDQQLAEQIRNGSEKAFVTLVRRYEQSIATLIRGRIGMIDAVEDVMQDTLVQAWRSLQKSTPRNVRAWLYQVARNRCVDFQRSRQFRDRTVEPSELEFVLDRRGIATESLDSEQLEAVLATFPQIPAKERVALESFYLGGLSIAEIAARHHCPPGTIKRRLSHGRDRIRDQLQTPPQWSSDMKNSFPAIRPDIRITPSTGEPFEVDLRELSWWFIVPEVGRSASYAIYDSTPGRSQWMLSEVNRLHAGRKAEIHGRECVEVDVTTNRHEVANSLIPADPEKFRKIWGRVGDEEIEWIAVESERQDGTRVLMTCLDEYWDQDFGSVARRIPESALVDENDDGSYSLQEGSPEIFAHGAFTVTIGSQRFDCMRVFDIDTPSESGVMVEAYVTRTGVTVLARRYNGNLWSKESGRSNALGSEPTWAKETPDAETRIFNGVVYVHYYDCLNGISCGFEDSPRPSDA